ncbi:hypothetical protein [Campylobacter concisus]|uniref:hypothetical protein n=1 Tax=Campylobacter concisus TaxID=199 RepID=UPI000CD8B38A|nr:hypothetical protein [Campylobacter concisus]
MSENISELSPRQKLAKEKRMLQAEMKLKVRVMELEAQLAKARQDLADKQQEIRQARSGGGNGSNQ